MMFEKSVDCTQQSGSDKSHKRVNELIRKGEVVYDDTVGINIKKIYIDRKKLKQ
jgi:hypothetical protein